MEMCFGTLAAVGDTSEEVTLLSETGGAGRGGQRSKNTNISFSHAGNLLRFY